MYRESIPVVGLYNLSMMCVDHALLCVGSKSCPFAPDTSLAEIGKGYVSYITLYLLNKLGDVSSTNSSL